MCSLLYIMMLSMEMDCRWFGGNRVVVASQLGECGYSEVWKEMKIQ